MSKGTFYLYFDSKQALLEDVLRRYTLLPNIQVLGENLATVPFEEAVRMFVGEAWKHLSDHRDLVLLALRELPSHVEQAQQALEHVFVPGNRLIAAYLEARLGPKRANEISLIVAGRGLIGMIIMFFVSHELLGASRYLPVDEEDITSTIADVFLHGVLGSSEAPK